MYPDGFAINLLCSKIPWPRVVRRYTQYAMRQNKLTFRAYVTHMMWTCGGLAFSIRSRIPDRVHTLRITYIALNDGFVRFPRCGRRSPCARAVVLLHRRDRFQFRIFISPPLDNLVYNAHVSCTQGVANNPGISRQRSGVNPFCPDRFRRCVRVPCTRDDGVYYMAYCDVYGHTYTLHTLVTHACVRQLPCCVRIFIIKYLERRRRR